MDKCVALEEVLCTAELPKRPFRLPDFETENQILCSLVQSLADSPDNILQTMVDTMLKTFRVGSAGCSLLTTRDEEVQFYWPAIAGALRTHVGGGTPRDFGPCGDVLDRNCVLLFRQPQRRYTYLQGVTPGIEECLLAPFHINGTAVGTIWLVAHDGERRFDSEDLRLLTSLSAFAASAYQAMLGFERMRRTNEALLLGSLRQHEYVEAEEKENEQLRGEIVDRKTTEAVLQQAIQRAEQASVYKSDFLTHMSHELRTPLGSILAFAQVMELSKPPPTDAQKPIIAQIKKAGRYLAELINDVLDLALVESGQMTLRMEPIAIAGILRECQTMVEPLATTRALTLDFPCTESQLSVLADRTRLKQIVINLLSNAIKYNRQGGSVHVGCAAIKAGRVRISIQDTGLGLTSMQISQLFQLYNRLGQESRGTTGTGIGLVMTKRLTELMGGAVGVESTVGEGSVFWVELNLSDSTEVIVVPDIQNKDRERLPGRL